MIMQFSPPSESLPLLANLSAFILFRESGLARDSLRLSSLISLDLSELSCLTKTTTASILRIINPAQSGGRIPY